jgi:hypothetical protein
MSLSRFQRSANSRQTFLGLRCAPPQAFAFRALRALEWDHLVSLVEGSLTPTETNSTCPCR